MVEIRKAPFYLDENQEKWVKDTLVSMTIKEKVGQLFCPMGFGSDDKTLDHAIKECHVGGMMYRTGGKTEIQNTYRKIQSKAKIPLLLAANTESGGDGLLTEGTSFGKPMAIAATGEPKFAYYMGYAACAEGGAAGMNWSFAPIIDIDYEFHNPITNVRTFGSDPQMVAACALEYLKGADEAGVAVAIKHFPGDGTDERDQHLLTSINCFDTDKWDETYGYVYKTLIDQGAKTVMVGHIAQPAYVEKINPGASVKEKLMPASLSKELLGGLLREKLGFQGVISTDSSAMVGFLDAMPRELAVPTAIAAGCDILLFNKDMDEDFHFMMQGIEKGILSQERLDEAVIRILALKSSLHLPEKHQNGTLVPKEEALELVGSKKHKEWAEKVADQAITLVKDTQNLLPLSTKKYKKIYLNVIQKDLDPFHPAAQMWKKLFEKEGFEVTLRDRSTTIEMENFVGIGMSPAKSELLEELYRSVYKFKDKTDLYVYIANVENASNQTTARLNWNVIFGLGDDAPWFVEEKPALFISTANPYHLFDAPMIKTMVNSYHSNPMFNEAVMDKIMGRSQFKGKSPVDPFCGNKYIRMISEE